MFVWLGPAPEVSIELIGPAGHTQGRLVPDLHVLVSVGAAEAALEGNGRKTLIFGQMPDWGGWLAFTGASLVIAWSGYWWFQKTRKGFADVV